MANEQKKNESQRSASPDAAVQGVRHVGRTLESDPEYNEQPSRALAPAAGLLSRSGNDPSASPTMRAGSFPENGLELTDSGERVERLKTRLPGDTSSDPHTDVGADNATSVQHRGEGAQKRR